MVCAAQSTFETAPINARSPEISPILPWGSARQSNDVSSGRSTAALRIRRQRHDGGLVLRELFARGPHDGPGTYESGDPNLGIERANSLEGTLQVNRRGTQYEGSVWVSRFNGYVSGALTGRTCDNEGACSLGNGDELKELLYRQTSATFRGAEGRASFPLLVRASGTLKARLLADGTAAVGEMGFGGALIAVVENTPSVHNLVVCTLCSCYPSALLGLPPTWYKSFAYRSRAVIEPRAVLHEFGLDLDDAVEVRVWDSSSELRYLVLPERPAGTDGLSEEELAALVTRDAMIGVAKVEAPATPVAAG